MREANPEAALVVHCTVSTTEALKDLVPAYEARSGRRLDIHYSTGPDLDRRIRAGLQGDVFIGPVEYSDPLIAEGFLQAGTRVPFAISTTGLAVRTGAPRPDISSAEALKATLLAARSISYSVGASGLAFARMVEQLGIAAAVNAKFVAPQTGEQIGAVVARGAAEIGIQQVSALLPVAGIDLVGPLPASLQAPIVYGGTAFTGSDRAVARESFLRFLCSAEAAVVLRRKGLEPA